MIEVRNASRSQLERALLYRPRTADLTDIQVDFALNVGKLPAPHKQTERILPKIDAFNEALPEGFFDNIIIKYDTHFGGEYPLSPEAKAFPDIHCEWGTPGWEYAVDLRLLNGKGAIYHMMKNNLDMYNTIPTNVAKEKIEFSGPEEEAAYDNLFRITTDLKVKGVPRDEWLDEKKIGKGSPVLGYGLFADYCDKFGWEGYIRRGCVMILPTDLSEKIFKDVKQLIEEDAPFEVGTVERTEEELGPIKSWGQAYRENLILLTTANDFLDCAEHVSAMEQSGLLREAYTLK